MPIIEVPYYYAKCDKCGAEADYGDFKTLADPESAIEWAIDNGWSFNEFENLCMCESCADEADEECEKL